MASDGARHSWATQSWMTESLSSSPASLSRSSSPWPWQLRFSSQASSEFGDYASTTLSMPPSPTSVPLPPALPNELAPPKPVHAIIHLKAELENILDCQRILRNDSRYVQSRLNGVDYKFGPHLIRAAPHREVGRPTNAVEQDLENDEVRMEERRKVLVQKIAELMNHEINEIRRANKGSGNSNLENGEKLDETVHEDKEAGSNKESETEKSKNDTEYDDIDADAVELQEWQYGDEEEQADIEEEEYFEKEHEYETTEVGIQSNGRSE